MIDLHTHTLFSDGELLPAELVRRAEEIGYEAIALTDHADTSNLDWIIGRIVGVCRDLNRYCAIRAVPGIELTHLPPEMIPAMVKEARRPGGADGGGPRGNGGGARASRARTAKRSRPGRISWRIPG